MKILLHLVRIVPCILLGGSLAFGQLTITRDGKLDRTYGVNGFAFIGEDVNVGRMGDTIILPDGKILQSHTQGWNPVSILVAKQLADGSPDTSFGTGGRQSLQLDGCGDGIDSLAMQPDGKVLLALHLSDCEWRTNNFVVVRLTESGVLDESFGNGGVFSLDLFDPNSMSSSDDLTESILIQPDGKIVIGGLSHQISLAQDSIDSFAVLMRVDSHGSVDTTFGTNGVSKVLAGNDLNQSERGGLNARFQQDGKILVSAIVAQAASFGNPHNSHQIVLRFLANGVLDMSFSDDGMIDLGSGGWECSAKQLSNGKILVLVDTELIRLNLNGVPDNTFGTIGRASIGPSPISLPSLQLTMDFDISSDGKIYVSRASARSVSAGVQRVFGPLQRFWPNGTPDLRFGTSGKSALDGRNFDLYFGRLKIIQEKYLVVTGVIGQPPSYSPFSAKLSAIRNL